jgi:hypothetical protein
VAFQMAQKQYIIRQIGFVWVEFWWRRVFFQERPDFAIDFKG